MRQTIIRTTVAFVLLLTAVNYTFSQTSDEQLATWLKKFPQADTNKDGTLTEEEAKAFRAKLRPVKKQTNELPPPTHADVAYGTHERNVMDLWLAPSEEPTPAMGKVVKQVYCFSCQF